MPRAGQTVLTAVEPALAPAHQVEALARLSDPALSELGLEEFLDELLLRVRSLLRIRHLKKDLERALAYIEAVERGGWTAG